MVTWSWVKSTAELLLSLGDQCEPPVSDLTTPFTDTAVSAGKILMQIGSQGRPLAEVEGVTYPTWELHEVVSAKMFHLFPLGGTPMSFFFWFILFDQRQWWIELVKVDGFLVTCSLQNSFFSSGFLCGKALTLPPTHWLRDFSDRWRPMGVDCIEFSGAMGWMKSEDSVIYAHNVITKTCWYLGYSRT